MTTLSNRQYPCLKIFARKDPSWIMPISEAAPLDQRPFRSLLMRKWIEWLPHAKGFRITWEGRDAWREYHTTDIVRIDPTGPLCAFFYSSTGVPSPVEARQKKRSAP